MPQRNTQKRNKRSTRYQGTKKEVSVKRVPKISTLAKKVKDIEDNVELKYNDTWQSGITLSTDPITAGTGLLLLNGIAQGNTQSTRIGSQVRCTSCQIRGYIVTNVNRLQTVGVRLIVFWDYQANGALPDVLGDAAGGTTSVLQYAGTATPPLVFAPYQIESQKRFKILYDKTMMITPQVLQVTTPASGQVASNQALYRKVKIKIPLSRTVKYDGTSAAIGNIVTNSLFLAVFADSLVNPPAFTYYGRVYYKDS